MTDSLLGRETCPVCHRPLLWIAGALRCANANCPGHQPDNDQERPDR